MTFNRRFLISVGFSLLAAPLLLMSGARADNAADGDIEQGSGHETWVHDGSGEPVRGSGKVISQVRDIPGFEALDLRDSTDVDVVIGSPTKVIVQGDDNVVDMIHTEVHGSTLVIDSRGSYHTWHGPKVSVQVPALTALHINGSGDANLRGLNGGHLDFSIEGSGDLLAEGDVKDVKLVIAGSGDARLKALRAKTADVEIDGSGDADVTVSETLHARVNGSGDITYGGHPHDVYDMKFGSGDINPR